LSDENKRKQYDQFGEAAFNQAGGSPFANQDSFDFHQFFQDSNMFFTNGGAKWHGSSGRRKSSAKSTVFEFDDMFNSGGSFANFGSSSGFDGMFDGFGNVFNWHTHDSGKRNDQFGDRNHHHNQYSRQQQHSSQHFDSDSVWHSHSGS
jgi:curved DNA-binding protein CbpA